MEVQDFNDYAERYTSENSEVLNELIRETNIKMLFPRMISGKIQGRLLKIICSIAKPTNILEIGTYTGYSAICLAQELPIGGSLITIDKNPEIEEIAHKYFIKSKLSEKIKLIIGNAIDIIPNLNHLFDVIYIDADKENYDKYYQLLFSKWKLGGLLIADNVFWSGKVLDPIKNTDKETQGIIKFNNTILNDKRVEKVFLPIRDGLLIIRKISD